MKPEALSREQWLARCAAHFRKVAALDEAVAHNMAKARIWSTGIRYRSMCEIGPTTKLTDPASES